MAKPARVCIYELSRGFDVFVWLCSKCVTLRLDLGWAVKNRKEPPHPLRCDDCEAP